MGLDRPIDITAEQRKTVLALLERHLPNTTAWVYGSRAKWTAHPQSDLDMVVFPTPEQEHRVSDLREAFEESDLPFRVDSVHLGRLCLRSSASRLRLSMWCWWRKRSEVYWG